jgi:hypothetical protein
VECCDLEHYYGRLSVDGVLSTDGCPICLRAGKERLRETLLALVPYLVLTPEVRERLAQAGIDLEQPEKVFACHVGLAVGGPHAGRMVFVTQSGVYAALKGETQEARDADLAHWDEFIRSRVEDGATLVFHHVERLTWAQLFGWNPGNYFTDDVIAAESERRTQV